MTLRLLQFLKATLLVAQQLLLRRIARARLSICYNRRYSFTLGLSGSGLLEPSSRTKRSFRIS